MKWTIWGNWPSENDLDLRLDTTPEELERLWAEYDADEWYTTDDIDSDEVRLSAIGLDPGMWEWAKKTAAGLPLDITLWERSPRRASQAGKFDVLVSEWPYEVGMIGVSWWSSAKAAAKRDRRALANRRRDLQPSGPQGRRASSMTTTEKIRENRLRRMADRQGLALHKSRRRDPRALDYGRFWLVDTATNTIVYGEPDSHRAATLDDIEEWLT